MSKNTENDNPGSTNGYSAREDWNTTDTIALDGQGDFAPEVAQLQKPGEPLREERFAEESTTVASEGFARLYEEIRSDSRSREIGAAEVPAETLIQRVENLRQGNIKHIEFYLENYGGYASEGPERHEQDIRAAIQEKTQPMTGEFGDRIRELLYQEYKEYENNSGTDFKDFQEYKAQREEEAKNRLSEEQLEKLEHEFVKDKNSQRSKETLQEKNSTEGVRLNLLEKQKWQKDRIAKNLQKEALLRKKMDNYTKVFQFHAERVAKLVNAKKRVNELSRNFFGTDFSESAEFNLEQLEKELQEGREGQNETQEEIKRIRAELSDLEKEKLVYDSRLEGEKLEEEIQKAMREEANRKDFDLNNQQQESEPTGVRNSGSPENATEEQAEEGQKQPQITSTASTTSTFTTGDAITPKNDEGGKSRGLAQESEPVESKRQEGDLHFEDIKTYYRRLPSDMQKHLQRMVIVQLRELFPGLRDRDVQSRSQMKMQDIFMDDEVVMEDEDKQRFHGYVSQMVKSFSLYDKKDSLRPQPNETVSQYVSRMKVYDHQLKNFASEKKVA